MHVSEKGIAALVAEEGEVLKAYRCPAGRWTIGVGMTAASGVIQPKAGMRITREESRRLLALTLKRNYEPTVYQVMGHAPGEPRQHEFDAGVSFHFNTGAIARASWVKRWLEGAPPLTIRAALGQWNKGGGRVLPGLLARRKREADMLLLGVYPGEQISPGTAGLATWGLRLSQPEKVAAREALRGLGYAVGDKADAIALEAVTAFQRDHELTADGILGRGTLSTLQRRIDAANRAAKSAVATVVAAPIATVGGAPDLTGELAPDLSHVIANLPWVAPVLVAVIALWFMWLGYRYRDVVAAKAQRFLPRVAALLRSF